MFALKLLLQYLNDKRFISSYFITAFLLLLSYKLNYLYSSFFSLLLVLLFSALYIAKKQKFYHFAFGILGGIVSILIGYHLRNFYLTFFLIREWDFLGLYIFGKAAADGLAFYDPSSFTNILSTINVPFKVSQDFYNGIILVGCDYPPTSMLLFAPLGLLSMNTALAVWRILILSFLVADIFLLFKIFKTHENKWMHLLVVTCLVLIMQSTFMTLSLCQTNFFLLFFILLSYRNTDNWKSGIFLALAVIIKPIAAIFSLYFLINKKWKPLSSFIITGIIISLVSIAIFGMHNFITFFTSPPTLRIPNDWYSDPYNQSLYAIIYRLSIGDGVVSLTGLTNMFYATTSIILTIITCISSYKFAKSNTKAAFLIFIPLSLLVYPLFWLHYAVILLPVFFEIISNKNKNNLIFTIIYIFILAFSGFAAVLTILLTFIIYSFLKIPIFSFTNIKTIGFK